MITFLTKCPPNNFYIFSVDLSLFQERRDAFAMWGYVCDSKCCASVELVRNDFIGTIGHPGLLEQLKAEKFDAAITETFDFCGPGELTIRHFLRDQKKNNWNTIVISMVSVVFHLLGIDKWAVTESVALKDGGFFYTQTPSNPAYVPCKAVIFSCWKQVYFSDDVRSDGCDDLLWPSIECIRRHNLRPLHDTDHSFHRGYYQGAIARSSIFRSWPSQKSTKTIFPYSGNGIHKLARVLQLRASRRLSQDNIGENHRHWRNQRVHRTQTPQQGWYHHRVGVIGYPSDLVGHSGPSTEDHLYFVRNNGQSVRDAWRIQADDSWDDSIVSRCDLHLEIWGNRDGCLPMLTFCTLDDTVGRYHWHKIAHHTEHTDHYRNPSTRSQLVFRI